MTFEGRFGYLLSAVTLCVQLMHDLLAIAEFLVCVVTAALATSIVKRLTLL